MTWFAVILGCVLAAFVGICARVLVIGRRPWAAMYSEQVTRSIQSIQLRAERDRLRKELGGAEDLAVVWRERAQLAEREPERLRMIIAWYWRTHGPYPKDLDRPKPETESLTALGWHVISGEDLLGMLERVAAGEGADLVYAEEYANARHERVEDAE